MCGRYGLTVDTAQLYDRYQIAEDDGFGIDPVDEIFPTNKPAILLPNGYFYGIKWGFEPDFAKRPLINARSETILEKPTFREPFSRKRCLIPATYFFEWDADKRKMLIAVEGLPIFSMAGICERYENEEGSYLTYAILTTEANAQMAPIHDRMPVILEPKIEQAYLNLDTNPYDLLDHLKPTERQLIVEEV